MWFPIHDRPQPDKVGRASPVLLQIGESGSSGCRECRNKLLKLGGIMNNTVLEFECIGMDGGSKFPIEYTGRGQDISPEFIIENTKPPAMLGRIE